MSTRLIYLRRGKNDGNLYANPIAYGPPIINVISIIGISLWLLVGCSSANHADPPQMLQDVSIQLSWTYGFQDVPFYAAEKNSHFADQQLAVKLINGGFKDGQYINGLDQVINGEADFGITDAYNLILSRAEGTPVVAVMAIYQRSPAALISLADQNITRPYDLINKRVALTAGAVTWTYEAMLGSQGIAKDRIKMVPRISFGIDPLLKDEADAMSGWIINEGIMIEEAGYEANFIVMGDYGTDTYPLLLFTTEHMIMDRPAVVQHFVNATLAGLQDVVNNPDQSANLILEYDSNAVLKGNVIAFRHHYRSSNPLEIG